MPTFEEIMKEMREKKFAPLYFLHGEEPFYIDQVVQFIENHALAPHEKGFNQTIVYGKDVTLQQIIETARRFPMMAKRQVVIVKEAQGMEELNKSEKEDKEDKKKGKEKAPHPLISYAQKPVPSTILVFAYKYKKLDQRSELAKKLNELAVCLVSDKIKDYQLTDWVSKYCQGKAYPIKAEACQLIAEHIGNDLSRITNELEKMLLNYAPNTPITKEMVFKHIGISKEFNIFELQKALTQKNYYKVFQIVDYFSANPKDNPVIPMIASLFGYFTKILLAHQHIKSGEAEVAKALQLAPFFVKEYIAATKSFSLAKVIRILGYIHEADLQSKGIGGSPENGAILKDLCLKILNG
ncbi:MAG: DNA polymerase III subunit delta [Flammeovirgaceae bacterium]